MNRLRNWAREPLTHFIGLGLLFFALQALLGRDEPNGEDRILVSNAVVQRLAQSFQLQWRRPPTAQELEGLVRSHIREEVLYREAMAMGLDRDDTVIRRRLAQKMNFLSEDIAEGRAPAEAELAAWFAENRDAYRISARLSLTQVYFNRDERGASAEADARKLLEELEQAPETPEPWMRGDRFMLPYEVRDQSEEELARVFGRDFASGVLELPPDGWHGPIVSGFGLHLVRVSRRVEPRIPGLDEVRDRVLRDFQAERRKRMNEAFYRSLRERYRVEIEEPELSRRIAEPESGSSP